MIMNPITLIYITRREAIANGMTHEGTLFGVPAWMAIGNHDNEIIAAPKVPLMQLWALLADGLLELMSWFMPASWTIESPIHIRNRIGDA